MPIKKYKTRKMRSKPKTRKMRAKTVQKKRKISRGGYEYGPEYGKAMSTPIRPPQGVFARSNIPNPIQGIINIDEQNIWSNNNSNNNNNNWNDNETKIETISLYMTEILNELNQVRDSITPRIFDIYYAQRHNHTYYSNDLDELIEKIRKNFIQPDPKTYNDESIEFARDSHILESLQLIYYVYGIFYANNRINNLPNPDELIGQGFSQLVFRQQPPAL
jgi:hypothetical protein